MSDAPATKLCSVCGTPVGNDSRGVMVVQPDGSATGKITYYCGEHNANPPTAEQLADRERQEMEAAAAFVRSQEERIRQLIDLDRPVTAVDRANIGTLLLSMHQRLVALANEVRQIQGKEPIPLTILRREATEQPGGDETSGSP